MTLTNIMTVRRGGKVRRYYRVKGRPLVRLPDAPLDSAVFLAAYAAAKGAVPERKTPAPGTLAGLCRAVLMSDRYHAAGKATRAMYRRHIDAMTEAHGGLPAKGIRTRHIIADVSGASAPGHRLRTWRFLCSFGADTGILHTDEAKAAHAPTPPKSDGHPPWTPAEIEAYRARWPLGTTPRATMELLFWTGARISDAVNLGRGMIDRDGVLTFRQAKTGDPAFIPWSCALPDYAAEMVTDRQMMLDAIGSLTGHMTFIATAQGRPRTSTGLGTLIRESAKVAGFSKSAHGLRKARAIALAEAGATVHQIASWTGHATLKEIDRYTRRADRRRAVMGTEQGQNVATATDGVITKGTKS